MELNMLQEDYNNIKVGEYNLKYLKVGNGPHCVLFMPGSLGNMWTNFKPQIEGFDRENFSLIFWEPPGQGQSRPVKKDFPTYYHEINAEAAFQLMQALNIPKFSLLGWCYGAMSSIMVAAQYPGAVHKLVVWGARSFLKHHELQIYYKLKDLSLWSHKMCGPMLELYGSERLRQYWLEVIETQEAVYHTNNGNICNEYLKDVLCPTLIMYGVKDPVVDKEHVSYLHSNIKGSRIHLYPEGKHNIHLRYGEDFNQTVKEFLLQDGGDK